MSRQNTTVNKVRALLLMVVPTILFALAYFWITRDPAGSEQEIDAGIAAFESGDIELAFEILSNRHQADPENRNVIYFLAVTQSLRGHLPNSVSLIESIPGFESDAQLQLMVGQFQLQGHQLIQARNQLISALKLQPQNPETLRLLANLEANLLNPNMLRLYVSGLDHLQLASAEDVFLYCTGDRAKYDLYENFEQLQLSLANTPEDPEVVYALFNSYVGLNRMADAKRLLDESRGKVNEQENWRLDLAEAEFAIIQKDFSRASDFLRDLPVEAEALPRTWLARGRASRAFPLQEKIAITAFRNAATLDPFDPEAGFMLSQLLKDSSPDEAKVLLKRSHDLQALNVQVESVVTLESIEEVVERIPKIAVQLTNLGAYREAYVCLLWLEKSGYRLKASQAQIKELANSVDAMSTLHVPSVQELEPWSSPALAGQLVPSPSNESQQLQSIRFNDMTSDFGLDFHYNAVKDVKTTVLTSLGGGVGAFDFDCDGLVDLFFPQGGSLPNAVERTDDIDRLFRLQGKRYVDVSTESGIGLSGYGHGVTTGDVNNDGFVDFLVTNFGSNELYLNNGDGTFEEVSNAWSVEGRHWSTSAAFADLDKDGDLDLYVVNYLDIAVEEMVPCTDERQSPCGPLSIPSQQDRIYENMGTESFADRTESASIVVSDGKGLGVVIADFNGNGSPDIFVGNDTTSNRLFAKTSEESFNFQEISLQAGVAFGGNGQAESCMGIACADFDSSGHLDLFVSNFEGEDNTLYSNLGEATFVDRTEELGLGRSSYQLMGWGAQFLNIDADGLIDLVVLNGHLHDRAMMAQVLQQTKSSFIDVAESAGDFFSTVHMGRSLAVADFNRDRKPDLVATKRTGAVHLLRNDSLDGHRLAIQLVGTLSNRSAIGARVTLKCGVDRFSQTLQGGGGYLSANEHRLYFAIGDHDHVDQLIVDWPNGKTEIWNDKITPETLLIIESQAETRGSIIQIQ